MSQNKRSDPPSQERAAMELRLRALHDLIPEAQEFPSFLTPYTKFLRSLRERLHPVGTPDLRWVETPSGLKFQVDLGDRLGCDFYYGYYAEMLESQLFLGLLEPGATVVDVGANFGYYAVSAGAKVGPLGAVHAFEPDPAAFKLLVTNGEANGLGNVRYHNICVGAEDGKTDFYLMEESAFSSLTATGRARVREKVTIQMRSLDSLLAEISVPTVSAVKIDVEGHEFAVLRGGRETIRRSPEAVLMVEVNTKNLDSARRAALESALRDLYADGARGWMVDVGPEGLRPLREPQEAATLGSANLFLVRAGSEPERQLRAAAQNFRIQAFQGLAKELGVESQVLLRHHAADPRQGLNLHAALLNSILRDRDERINALVARLEWVEGESQARRVEILKRDERLKAAKEEIEHWRREAAIGWQARVLRRIRGAWLGMRGT